MFTIKNFLAESYLLLVDKFKDLEKSCRRGLNSKYQIKGYYTPYNRQFESKRKKMDISSIIYLY